MKLFPLWNREDKSPGGVAKCLFCSIWDRNAGLSDDSFALAQCKILVLVIFLTYVLFQLVKRVCGLEFGREDYRCKTGDHDKDEEEAVDDIFIRPPRTGRRAGGRGGSTNRNNRSSPPTNRAGTTRTTADTTTLPPTSSTAPTVPPTTGEGPTGEGQDPQHEVGCSPDDEPEGRSS
ncbi:unnamed protein product [Amoebophrya sp. A25]|nr:unnamed protein product [Amoebophrya sp. A25]|eukprot:GSA25T00012892001.1